MVTMTCFGLARDLDLCKGWDVLCHTLECSCGCNLHGLITFLHNRILIAWFLSQYLLRDLLLCFPQPVLAHALIELHPMVGLYPARMEITEHEHPVPERDPWSCWNLFPAVERKCQSSRRLHVSTGLASAQSGDCIVWQEAASSPSRRKDFPSPIFLKKAFAATKQSTVRDTKYPFYSGSLLLHWWMRDLFALFCSVLFNNCSTFSGAEGKTQFLVQPVQVNPEISPGHSPSLPGLLHTVCPFPGEGTSLQWQKWLVISALCSLCAGHCSAHPAAGTWTWL